GVGAGGGWAHGAARAGVVGCALAPPPPALPLRPRPADLGVPPFGGTEVEPAPTVVRNPFAAATSGLALARHSRDFWLLAGSFFICGLSTNGLIGTHLIPAAMDHGYGEVAAAGLLATIGVFDIVGTTCSGWLTDRYDPRVLL